MIIIPDELCWFIIWYSIKHNLFYYLISPLLLVHYIFQQCHILFFNLLHVNRFSFFQHPFPNINSLSSTSSAAAGSTTNDSSVYPIVSTVNHSTSSPSTVFILESATDSAPICNGSSHHFQLFDLFTFCCLLYQGIFTWNCPPQSKQIKPIYNKVCLRSCCTHWGFQSCK